MLQKSIDRYQLMYQRLVKQKLKQSGINCSVMQASNTASKQTQAEQMVQQLSTQQRIKLISTIAKAEIEIEPELVDMIQHKVLQICQSSQIPSDLDLYFTSLYIFAADLDDNIFLLKEILIQIQDYLAQINQNDDEIQTSLNNNLQFQQKMDFAVHILRKGIVKRDQTGTYITKVVEMVSECLKEFVQQKVRRVSIVEFAPQAVLLEIVEDIFYQLKRKNQQIEVSSQLKELISLSFELLEMYKETSKYYMVKIGSDIKKQNNSQTGEQTAQQPAVRREGCLFQELLSMIVDFICCYLTQTPQEQNQQYCAQVFQILTSQNNEQSNFILLERLTLLNELNFLFQKLPQVYEDDGYWQLIRQGLYDQDQACRKLALNVLKSNLKITDSSKFELEWTAFFDVFDTLESFGSHLTKAVWHRTEVFYEFIRRNEQRYQHGSIPQLEDMRMWLLVLYHRVGSHNNLKIRKFVQKTTLTRQYITPSMTRFFFSEFVSWLNQGLIFRDVNSYTQFSKNAKSVLDFYNRYFKNESIDLQSDLRQFFLGFSKNMAHTQMIMICLKILSTKFDGETIFLEKDEIQQLCQNISTAFLDQIMSSKYLCFKYILQMCSIYINPDLDEWSNFFKLVGNMPVEFFSSKTIYDDQQAKTSSLTLVRKLKDVNQVCLDYLSSLLTVKANVTSMPKFGKDADVIVRGIAKTLLASPEGVHVVLQLESSLVAVDQATNSSYLSAKLVESKIHSLVCLTTILYEYGSEQMQQALQKLVSQRLALMMVRLWDQLFIPLSQNGDLLASQKERAWASLAEIKSYGSLIQLAVKMLHVHMSSHDSALESTIKKILAKTLQITSSNIPKSWSSYLLQYSCFEIVSAMISAYSSGITESIRRGVTHCHIPEDLFVLGNPLLQNFLSYKPFTITEITQQHEHLMIELDTNISKINQQNIFNMWKSIGCFLVIFQFDPQLKQEIQLHQQQLFERTMEFLDSATQDYNQHLFFILKTTYVPVVIQGLDVDPVNTVEQYQLVIRRCWSVIKQLQRDVDAESLLEFMEFAFNIQIMDKVQQLQIDNSTFCNQMCEEIIQQGEKYWLIMRSLFNHLMMTFAARPYLMYGYEWFIVKLGTCREIRSLDSDVKLYKFQTLLPEAIPKKYENLPLDQITYQGAYTRTLTLIVIEKIVKEHQQNYLAGNVKQEILKQAIENLMMNLLNLNLDKKSFVKSESPYSEPHRFKIRTWQFIVLLQGCFKSLDPEFVLKINDVIWPILKQNHPTNVRQYIEVFAIKFITQFPQITLQEKSLFYDTCMDNSIVKPNLCASLLLITGFVLLKTQQFTNFKRKIFDRLIGFATSNSAHLRCITQYFILRFSEHEPGLVGSAVQPLIDYLKQSKDVQKMMLKYSKALNQMNELLELEGAQAILCQKVDDQGEFMSKPTIEELDAITLECMSEYRHGDDEEVPLFRKDYWKNEYEERKKNQDFSVKITAESTNYQRKILPWEYVEYDKKTQKRVFFQRQRNEIIICASLIDKVPNLAGLARTSEIMNAQSLIINSALVCQLDEFKGISVTSEKWLPIYEVKEKDLLNYLMFQKSNGFKIVGIEQTANSQMLHKFEFPRRCVLLLGKEKEGIPQEYYSLLDLCVEIPQFGIVRSLNVHVSGALCLWEYTRQHMPNPAPSTQTNIQ